MTVHRLLALDDLGLLLIELDRSATDALAARAQ